MTRKRDLLARIAELEAGQSFWADEAELRGLRAAESAFDVNSLMRKVAELEADLAAKTAALSEEAQRNIRLGEAHTRAQDEWRAQMAERGAELTVARDLADTRKRWMEHYQRRFEEQQGIAQRNADQFYTVVMVGDRLLKDASSLARREWAVARTGRNPRDARGRLVKVEL